MTSMLRSPASRSVRSNGDSMRTQRGFTMLELVFVVAVILIVSGITLPMVTRLLQNYKLRNDARSLVGQISTARMLAASNTQRAMVSCDETHNICQIKMRGMNDASFGAPVSLQTTLSGTDKFGPPGTVGAGATTNLGSQVFMGVEQCDNIVFNSRGLPIYDALAATAACTQTPTVGDGGWVLNYVNYIKDGQGGAIAVVVDPSGKANLYQWDSAHNLWNTIPD